MKTLFLFLLTLTLLYGEKITITADNFEAYENKKVSILKGHVHVQKGSDDIKAKRLQIDFDQANKPLRYTLTGDVKFDISTKSQHFVGTARKVIYDPHQKRYIAEGDVFLKEKKSGRTLQGEKIVIDRISGKTTISGKRNRPVKFTFTVEE